MNITAVTGSLRIREYYYMLVRHKLILLLSMVLCGAVAVFAAVALPRIYRAESVLLIENEQILNPLISGLAVTPAPQARMRALREQLLSWPRLTLLAKKLQLDKKVTNPLQFETLINNLRSQIAVKLKGDGLVTVAFEGTEPQKSLEIVETLSGIIVEGTITSTDIEANSAIQFIQEQLNQYRRKLEDSERKLREFQEIYSSTLPLATRLNEQLVSLKMQLHELLVENTDKHPRVTYTRDLIARLEEQRNQQFQAAKAAGLDVSDESYAKLISSVPMQEQQMARLKRDYDVNNTVYQQLLQRLETAKISQTLEDSDKGLRFRVLEPARLPLKPVKPTKILILLAGIAGGLGLGVVLVYLIELSNTSIRNLEEAHQLLGLPVFGAIGVIKPEELLLSERMSDVRV